MYERYETTYFCKLWRSVEASNLIALDFNGDFVLYVHRSRIPACCCCCMSHLSGAQCSSFVCLDNKLECRAACRLPSVQASDACL